MGMIRDKIEINIDFLKLAISRQLYVFKSKFLLKNYPLNLNGLKNNFNLVGTCITHFF